MSMVSDRAAREWAAKVERAERAFRWGPYMKEIRDALDGLGMFDLAAAAGGYLPEEVTTLPQYSIIDRGIGGVEGRSVLLAQELLAEREEDLSSWIDRAYPALEMERAERCI